MIKVLFETHHLYYLPNFLPIVDELVDRCEYDIYFSMPQHINKTERGRFNLACKDLGLKIIDADDEELPDAAELDADMDMDDDNSPSK